MLKHETLVLTLAALEKIEEKLLFQKHKFDRFDKRYDTKNRPKAQPVYKQHGNPAITFS